MDNSWSYVVPTLTFEVFTAQLRSNRRFELFDRIRIEIHADVTRRIYSRARPGSIPVGMMSADIDSVTTLSSIRFSGSIPIEQISQKKPIGKFHRGMIVGGNWGTVEEKTASGPEWVYPGEAADGIFRLAVDMVKSRGHLLVEEMLRL